MLQQSITIALIVLSIHYTMLPGEIFAGLRLWLEKRTPSDIHPAIFDCNVCMCPYYGSALYWALYHEGVVQWLVVVIVAMGINIVINRWSHDE